MVQNSSRRVVTALVSICFLFSVACEGERARRERLAANVARQALEGIAASNYDRVTAAGTLLNLGYKEGQAVLAEAITSDVDLARRAAVGAVLTLQRVNAMSWLEDYVEGSDDLRRSVLQGLRFTPRADAREFIRESFWYSDDRIKVAALDAAALMRDVELLRDVESVYDNSDERRVRVYAVYAAARLGSERLPKLVEPLLESQDDFFREVAAASLGFGHGDWADLALAGLVQDSEPRVQIAAWASRARRGDETAKDRLIEEILSGNNTRATLAAGALRRALPAQIVGVAEQVVGSDRVNISVAGRVLEAVGWAREIEAYSVLSHALEASQDELLKLQSLWAVGWRGRDDELDLAESSLQDGSIPVRVMAAWALVFAQRGGYLAALSPTSVNLEGL